MNPSKIIILAILTGSILLHGTARAQTQTPIRQDVSQSQRGQLSDSDYRFLEKAARGGIEEVELGQLAQQKGVSQAVKSFGERMVADHKKANDELKQIAQKKGATFPAEMSHKENSRMHSLQKATGADFDKTYAREMIKDHRHDVKEFQDAAKNTNDPDLKAFAQKTLPTLQEHLRLAESMEPTVKSER